MVTGQEKIATLKSVAIFASAPERDTYVSRVRNRKGSPLIFQTCLKNWETYTDPVRVDKRTRGPAGRTRSFYSNF